MVCASVLTEPSLRILVRVKNVLVRTVTATRVTTRPWPTISSSV